MEEREKGAPIGMTEKRNDGIMEYWNDGRTEDYLLCGAMWETA
jgi:hypothetical protein